MFSSFEAPSQGEGFEEIKYVGMPSLKMLSETFLRFYSLSMKKSFL
jgi:hypothetical protein